MDWFVNVIQGFKGLQITRKSTFFWVQIYPTRKPYERLFRALRIDCLALLEHLNEHRNLLSPPGFGF